MRYAKGLMILALCSSAVASALAAEQRLIVVEPPTVPGAIAPLPVSLGSGWNFASGTPKAAACVTGTPSPEVPRTTYETAGEFTDASTLAESIKISAQAQASFIVGSADAEAHYTLSHKARVAADRVAVYAGIRDLKALIAGASSPSNSLMHQFSTALSEPSNRESHSFGPFNLSSAAEAVLKAGGIALKDEYLKILTTQGLTAFEAICGQGYVDASETGADLVGFYQFDSSSLDVQHQVSGGLKGSVLGQSANVSLESIVNSVNDSTTQFIDFKQFGGSPQNLPNDKAGFLHAIQDFPQSLSGSSKLFRLYVAPYSTDSLSNWPPGVQPSSPSVTAPLDKLVEQYWLLDAIYEQLGVVIAQPNAYILTWGTTLNDAKAHQAEVLDLQRKLQNSIKACDKEIKCPEPPLNATSDYYTHLLRLPLPIAWSPEYARLLTTIQNAHTTVNSYNQAHHQLVADSQHDDNFTPGSDPTCYKRNHLNHTLLDPVFDRAIKPILAELRSGDRDLPQQLQTVLRTTTFEIANRSRCGLSRSAFGCASATELDTWVQRMPRTGPHGVQTNDGDNQVRGECPATDLYLDYSP